MLIQPMADQPCPESPYQEIYTNDEHYHHSDKGCEIEMRRDNKFTIGSLQDINYAYCKTHNCFCSRTGWEFHWYMGTNSLKLNPKQVFKICKQCGQRYSTNTDDKNNLCQSCININEN